jgi:hypothetical protein
MLGSRRSALFAMHVSLALLVCFTGRLSAQQVFGSIVGTVTDASGGAVNNAKITITDIQKATKFEVTTNESGNYTKGQLIPDQYQVSIEATGFQRAVSNPITVQVDAVARFDVALQVGNVTQEVEVTAAAPLLQSDRADVSQTFDAHQIEELPSVGRNLQAFELMNPGTVPFGWAHASDENPQGSVQMIFNGQVFDSMGYELDGTTNQDPILGIIVINPTFDSVAEVKQSVQDFDAEFSYTGGGMAEYSTKSGTNEYHGDAFEYLQVNTPGFQDFARNPFTNANPVYRQNQFGGSIGGKILKDKLFFFADTQLNRQALGGSVNTSVPTALNRTGNFSDWLALGSEYQLYNPFTGNPANGTGRQPFAGNIIPQSLLSPQALAIMNYWPLPNTSQFGTVGNNYDASGDVAITGNLWNTRWDYYLNNKNTIFGRYSYAAYTEQAPGAFGLEAGGPNFGNYAGDSQALNQSVAIGWTYTFSPTVINEFRFGYMRYHVFDVPNGYGTDPAKEAGIPGLNLDSTYTSGMPYFDVQDHGYGDAKLGYGLGVNQCNCPLTQTERQIQFIDNVTKIHGNHSFKFGADLRYAENLRVPSDSHRAGELYFNGNQTGFVSAPGASPIDGLGLASFLLGDVNSFDRYVSSSTNAQERQKRFFWYGQDQWRVTNKLTASLGVRWEMVFPESVNAAGNGSTLDLSNGLMYVFGEGGVSSHGIQNMNWHEFAPRVGLAYQLDKKTVIRAGYGWSYNLGTFGSTFGHNVTQNPPVLDYQSINNPASTPFDAVFTLAQGPTAPTPVTVGSNGTFPLPNGISPKFRPAEMTMPVVYQYNFTVQRQIRDKISISSGYVGNSQRHGWIGTSNTINPNEAEWNPQTNTATQPYFALYGWTQGLGYYCNCTNQQYNSWQTTFTVKNWAGWTLQGSYTYQRLNTWDGPYDTNYYFIYGPQNGAGGYGDSSLIPHNQITLANNYDVPFGHGQKFGSSASKPLDAALGGWTLGLTTTYYSGLPFSPTIDYYGAGSVRPSTGPNNRPVLGSGPVYAPNQNRNQWIEGCPDQQCTSGPYMFPSSSTFGNYPIDTLIGPRFINFDFMAMKSFHITEKISFALRMDSRNFFNHTNLGGPNADVTAPNVGQITNIAFGGNNGVGMRTLQLSGTVRF